MSTIRQRLERAALESCYGVIARSEALELGITKRQIDRRVARKQWLSAPVRGYYIVAEQADDPLALLMAVVRGLDGMAWGPSALHLWGLGPVPDRPVVASARGSSGAAYKVAQPNLGDMITRTVRRGIRTCTPGAAIASMGTVVDDQEIQRLIDAAIDTNVATWAAMEQSIRTFAARGRSGSTRLRRILAQRAYEPLPPPPGLGPLLASLEASGLNRPMVRYPVRLGTNNQTVRLDLAYPGQRYGIAIGNGNYQPLIQRGWHVRPISRFQAVKRPRSVLAMIRADLARRQPTFAPAR